VIKDDCFPPLLLFQRQFERLSCRAYFSARPLRVSKPDFCSSHAGLVSPWTRRLCPSSRNVPGRVRIRRQNDFDRRFSRCSSEARLSLSIAPSPLCPVCFDLGFEDPGVTGAGEFRCLGLIPCFQRARRFQPSPPFPRVRYALFFPRYADRPKLLSAPPFTDRFPVPTPLFPFLASPCCRSGDFKLTDFSNHSVTSFFVSFGTQLYISPIRSTPASQLSPILRLRL